MLLVIEQTKVETDTIQKEIDELQESLKSSASTDVFEPKLNEVQTEIKSFESKIKELKIKKFTWDTKDYTTNKVYKFNMQTNIKKKVSWADSPFSISDLDFSEGEEASSSGKPQHPFLEWHAKANKNLGYLNRKKRYKTQD